MEKEVTGAALPTLTRHTSETLAVALIERGVSASMAVLHARILMMAADYGGVVQPSDRAWIMAIVAGNVRAVDMFARRVLAAERNGGAVDMSGDNDTAGFVQ